MKTIRFFARTNSVFLAILILFLLAPVSCSKDDEPDPGPAINEYFDILPSWNDFSPVEPDEDIVLETVKEFSCNNLVVKSTTPCSITRTPEDIVTYDPNSEILYLGSLIQGTGYLGGLGSMESLPIYQRAPLPITISFQMSNNSRLIENPSLITVKQGIAELVEAAQDAGHVSGSSIFFNQTTSHSFRQTALALGLSADYMAAHVQTSLQWQGTTETTTVSAYFVQKMFTVSMGIPQRPSDLFSEEFTEELLNEQVRMGRIGPDNLPVYLSNIVYGRMMTLTMTSTFSETEMKAALSASYGAIEGNISAEHLNTLQNSTIKLVTIGGDAQTALDFLRTGQLGEFFKNDAPLTTAVPISYTLRCLVDNSIAKVSKTVEYDMVENVPISEGLDFFKNQGNWETAFPYQAVKGEWLTNRPNIWKANEKDNFVQNNVQIWMGKRITFSSDTTNMPFDFYLENKDPNIPDYLPNSSWALVFEDDEADWPQTISIGDIDNYEFDNFEIGVSGNNVYGLGFNMVDNSTNPNEYIKIYAHDGSTECEIGHISHSDAGGFSNGFLGVIAPVPVTRIFFRENDDGDDIGVKHFYFGYIPDAGK
jgi:hypothetical protein